MRLEHGSSGRGGTLYLGALSKPTYPLAKPQVPASDVLQSFRKEAMYEETIKALEDRSGYRSQLTTWTQHVGGFLQEFAPPSNIGPPRLSCTTRIPLMEESRQG
jgi:hypothetical protein